jgi:hypothetical protein
MSNELIDGGILLYILIDCHFFAYTMRDGFIVIDETFSSDNAPICPTHDACCHRANTRAAGKGTSSRTTMDRSHLSSFHWVKTKIIRASKQARVG